MCTTNPVFMEYSTVNEKTAEKNEKCSEKTRIVYSKNNKNMKKSQQRQQQHQSQSNE